jgi:glutamate formiminotransferase/formiminotetrahydrofolate cyclodeaminase
MVAALTYSKRGMEGVRPVMSEMGIRAQELKDWYMDAVDRDTAAFNDVLAAIRLPRKSDANRDVRESALAAANLAATLVPLEVLEKSVDALGLVLIAARDGNPNSVTDAGVAGRCAIAAAEGASLNVRINLAGLEGDTAEVVARHDAALARSRELAAEVAAAVEAVLSA